MELEERVMRMKKKLKHISEKRAANNAKMEQVMEDLNKLGYASIEEAMTSYEAMEEEYKRAVAKLTVILDELDEKYSNV